MRAYQDGVQLHSSSLPATSPPPALTSNSWAASIASPQRVPVTCLRSVRVKERMEAEEDY